MRKSRFTEAQIVAILQEADAGMPVAEVIRKHGIGRPTYFNWKAKYGSASVPELRRLKELEQENAKLKGMYADHLRTVSLTGKPTRRPPEGETYAISRPVSHHF